MYTGLLVVAEVIWKRKTRVQICPVGKHHFYLAKGIWVDLMFIHGTQGNYYFVAIMSQPRKPSIRIPLPRNPFLQLMTMAQVVSKIQPSWTRHKKDFNSGKTNYYPDFERRYVQALKDQKERHKRQGWPTREQKRERALKIALEKEVFALEKECADPSEGHLDVNGYRWEQFKERLGLLKDEPAQPVAKSALQNGAVTSEK